MTDPSPSADTNRRPVYARHEVFVVGGQPTVTYNPRPTQGIDQGLRDYLDERGRILCITGPTKSGKTVLVRQVVPNAIRISGGEIASIHDFWKDIVDELEGWTEKIAEDSATDGSSTQESLSGGLRVFGSGGEIGRQTNSSDSQTKRVSQVRVRDPRRVAKKGLIGVKAPVIVDDFHHIEPDIQRQMVRGVKELVFEGVPIIFIAVPHRAADIVRSEREMQGRVQNLQIEKWSEDELGVIADAGFDALNVDCDSTLAKRLASESYGSPHLMQDFCLQICKNNKIEETLNSTLLLRDPDSAATDEFFRATAQGDQVDDTYRRLAQGPRQRTDRKPRTLRNGVVTDIYGVVLEAIASTGPKVQLDWTEIRSALRRVMRDEPPARGEYTRVLEQMSDIAKKLVWDEQNHRFIGDPVLEFDADLGVLYISDPFFAYQLRWGGRDLSSQ